MIVDNYNEHACSCRLYKHKSHTKFLVVTESPMFP